jgi:hypothetical protein
MMGVARTSPATVPVLTAGAVLMRMQPQLFYVIPTETEQVARAAFPKGCAILRIRDELGMRCADQDFTALFSAVGQPALSLLYGT